MLTQRVSIRIMVGMKGLEPEKARWAFEFTLDMHLLRSTPYDCKYYTLVQTVGSTLSSSKMSLAVPLD
jgi:hypothetical protein